MSEFSYRSNGIPTLRRSWLPDVVLGLLVSMMTWELAAETLPDNTVSTVLKVGVRTDAKPFSYPKLTSGDAILPGFGGYSVEVCRHVLGRMKSMPAYRNFVFDAQPTTANDRFSQLDRGELFMLCGPDSINTERLQKVYASHPVFLSGMTYAYLNPRSREFPTGSYCGNIIGVVRGTTADTDGLRDLEARGLLMRFNDALRLDLHKSPGRVAKARKKLLEVAQREVDSAHFRVLSLSIHQRFVGKLNQDERQQLKVASIEIPPIVKLLAENDPLTFDYKLNRMPTSGLKGLIYDRMGAEYGKINYEIAQSIETAECPNGFESLPIRKYNLHSEGVKAFCNGDVLYYLADYDILNNKIKEFGGCEDEVVMNRFTRSREVYGVLFSKWPDAFAGDMGVASNSTRAIGAEGDRETEERVSLVSITEFYTEFNNQLLLSMQGSVSDIEEIFSAEFGHEEMSPELEQFFESFKLSLPP